MQQINVASLIDHTLLKPDTPLGEFTQAYRDASFYGFKSICVNSGLVPLMSHIIFSNRKNTVALCSTVGFPLGSSSIDAKLLEINQGLKCGVSEFDAVPLLSAIKSQDWHHFENEIIQLREATKGFVLKVIFEVGLLTIEEVKKCCDICVSNEVDFVKTSTGFLAKLTPVETSKYVSLMAACTIGTKTQVKASGGIKTLADVNLMLDSGASRVGTSNSMAIMQELLK